MPRKAKAKPANDNTTPLEHVLSIAAKKSKASRSGVKGEQLVAAMQIMARHRGIVHLVHVPTPTRRVKTKAGWSAIYTGRSVVDSLGYMLDGSGRVAAEEIKSCTSKPSFSLREVEDHQRAYLDGVMVAGGVAALTIVFGAERSVHVIPWAEARGRAKFGAADLEPYRVTADTYFARFVRPRIVNSFGEPVNAFGEPLDPLRLTTVGIPGAVTR